MTINNDDKLDPQTTIPSTINFELLNSNNNGQIQSLELENNNNYNNNSNNGKHIKFIKPIILDPISINNNNNNNLNCNNNNNIKIEDREVNLIKSSPIQESKEMEYQHIEPIITTSLIVDRDDDGSNENNNNINNNNNNTENNNNNHNIQFNYVKGLDDSFNLRDVLRISKQQDRELNECDEGDNSENYYHFSLVEGEDDHKEKKKPSNHLEVPNQNQKPDSLKYSHEGKEADILMGGSSHKQLPKPTTNHPNNTTSSTNNTTSNIVTNGVDSSSDEDDDTELDVNGNLISTDMENLPTNKNIPVPLESISAVEQKQFAFGEIKTDPAPGHSSTDNLRYSPIFEELKSRRIVVATDVTTSNPNSPISCSVDHSHDKKKNRLSRMFKKSKDNEKEQKKDDEEQKDILGEHGKIDIFMGLALVHSYYSYLLIRNWNCVSDKAILEEGLRYQKFSTCAYGRKLYYGLMEHMSPANIFRTLAGSNKTNIKIIERHIGIKKKDIIVSKWYSSRYSPGHYLVVEKDTKSIVLVIRGTFNHFDVISDLVATSFQLKSGLIHLGILLCAHKKMKELHDIVLKALDDNPGYRFIVTGHSLGAGVASLFTILFHDAHPEIPIHCYAFGVPCILSYELATHPTVQSLITSFAMNDDLIPRLSFCSLYFLREVLDTILSQSKSKIQRGFQIVSAGNGLGEKLTKKISRILKVSPTIDLSNVEHVSSGEIHMFPPGSVYRIVKLSKGCYVTEKVDTKSFDKLIVSSNMFTDHMPQKYEKGLESSIVNIYKKEYITVGENEIIVENPLIPEEQTATTTATNTSNTDISPESSLEGISKGKVPVASTESGAPQSPITLDMTAANIITDESKNKEEKELLTLLPSTLKVSIMSTSNFSNNSSEDLKQSHDDGQHQPLEDSTNSSKKEEKHNFNVKE
eukprot:gene4681-5847_t